MNVKIEAKAREKGKKSDLNKLRNDGFIPAIIYGEGNEGVKITLEKISFMKAYRKSIGEMVLFDIELDGKNFTTILKDKQLHPVTREFVHIDFQELHQGVAINVNVPFTFVGEPKGITQGGILDINLRDIEISCLPKDIPEDIKVDISGIGLDESLHIKDIDLGGLETKISPEITLASVRSPKIAEEPVEEEGTDLAKEVETEETE